MTDLKPKFEERQAVHINDGESRGDIYWYVTDIRFNDEKHCYQYKLYMGDHIVASGGRHIKTQWIDEIDILEASV
jgi:hypothetical protein